MTYSLSSVGRPRRGPPERFDCRGDSGAGHLPRPSGNRLTRWRASVTNGSENRARWPLVLAATAGLLAEVGRELVGDELVYLLQSEFEFVLDLEILAHRGDV